MKVPVDPNRLLREGEAHFLAGRHAAALPPIEQVVRMVPGNPAVLHLYGLVLSRLDRVDDAARALRLAHAAAPGDARIANSLGNVLGRIGDAAGALDAYDRAVAADPGFADARLNRAMTLDELGRWDKARAEIARIAPQGADVLLAAASIERNAGNLPAAAGKLDAVLAQDPGHALARRGRARLALDLGAPDAADRHIRALADAPDDRELLLGYLGSAETPEVHADAIHRIDAATAADPGWHEGQMALAAALWEAGERQTYAAGLERAVQARPRDARLWKTYVTAAGKVDDHAAAATICLRAEAATGDVAFAGAALGYLSAAGRLDEAEAVLARLPRGAVPPLSLAKHRLRQRDAAAADRLLASVTESMPDNVEAWALRGIAWQLLDDPRFEWLNGQPNLVAVHDLPLSLKEIDSIAASLRAAHRRSRLRAGQSVRGGTQTHGNILDRAEPELVLLGQALRAAVERHRAALPPADPAHPLLRHRDRPFAFSASWSIRLTGGGFHVRHMHPKGIVSAASYWALPEPAAGEPQAGWLEIGGAPDYLALDLPPVRVIEPKVARLALFPSTLHHGTRPFPAGERISVAFDVVPR